MLCVFDTGRISLTKRYLTWKIDNFYKLPLIVDSEIRSQEFPYGNSRYTLVIWPRGRKGSAEEWFGICLYKYDAPGSNDFVQFSIVSDLGRTINSCTVQCSENNLFRQERFMEWSDFHALGHTIVPDGCLTILCKLPVDPGVKKCIQDDNIRGVSLTRPMHDPPVKFQSGDFHTVDPVTTILKLGRPEEQVSCPEVPGVNSDSPSTINSFYSTSSSENSSEGAHESTGGQFPDPQMSPNVPSSTPKNTFWSSITRGRFQGSNRNKPEVVLDTSEEVMSESFQNSETTLLEIGKSAANSNSSKVNLSNPATANSDVYLSQFGYVSSSTADSYPRGMKSAESSPSAAHYPKGLKILSEQMKKLYLDGKIFDLTIIMAGTEFKVLRGILMSRSPVFDIMLSEDISNVITIDPFGACDSSVFHDFLLYIYSGEIENLSLNNVHGIFSVACKFEISHLKEECIEFLLRSLSIDTITGVLRSAGDDDSEVLDVALIFLARNLEVIMNTDEWKEFTKQELNRVIQYQIKALNIGFQKMMV